MPDRTLVVIGFGPIGAELFLDEAYRSGNFSEMFVSEVDQATVNAIRANGGSYTVNIATLEERFPRRVEGVRICNPNDPHQRDELIAALGRADEVVTALPNVRLYSSVADLLVEGLQANRKPVVFYTAENDNHAAEQIKKLLSPRLPQTDVVFLNTVIGKMSQRIVDSRVIDEMRLDYVTPGLEAAFLVEETPQILLCRSKLPDTHNTALGIFQEKQDLLPFEEAKLYGHNAVHALMGYLLSIAGSEYMHEGGIQDNGDILSISRRAFLYESGAALIYMGTSGSDDVVGTLVDIWREKTTELGNEAYKIAGDIQKAHICLIDWLRKGKPNLVKILSERGYVPKNLAN